MKALKRRTHTHTLKHTERLLILHKNTSGEAIGQIGFENFDFASNKIRIKIHRKSALGPLGSLDHYTEEEDRYNMLT